MATKFKWRLETTPNRRDTQAVK
uniref:Uncharacterized protein n=1 Tax=Arundo donax TaxID=35708 RepID=A0A0A8ZMQ3_ARUDO